MSVKLGATILTLALVSWLAWFGFWMFRSEQHMGVVRSVIAVNPVLAFVSNVTAYQDFPYQVENRRQIGGAFLALIGSGRAEINDDAAEVVWSVTSSVSPLDAGALVSRGAYLLNYGRRAELPPIADRLKQIAPWAIETWIIEAYVALDHGDKERMASALDRARASKRLETRTLNALADEFRRLQ